MDNTIKAVVLVGPTGVGKTSFSLEVAENFFEIVSADSVQVYKHMNIGSGKLAPDERKNIKHHLIDEVEPDYPFSAGDYCRFSSAACRDINNRNKYPLFVGGTGLYINAFFFGLSNIPDVDVQVRQKLEIEVEDRGLDNLYADLILVDESFAKKIHPNDRQRIIRGLEVFRSTGRPLSAYYPNKNSDTRSEGALFIGLFMDREVLRRRIDQRVDSMIQGGFIEEVQSLRERGYTPELKSMKSIGYREINGYLDGECSRNEAINNIKSATKKYAKRQMTWFRKIKQIHWFPYDEKESIKILINSWKE